MALPLRKILQKNQQAVSGGPSARGESSGRLHGFSAATAAALGLALVAAVGWAFFMGYQVGRGEHPARGVESVADMLRPGAPAPETASAPDAPKADASATPEAAPAEAAAKEAQAEPAQAATKEGGYPFKRPQGEGLAAWGIRQDAQGEAARTPERKATAGPKSGQNASAVPGPKKQEPAFDYQFQAAAFKGPQDAERLRGRLEGAGLRARVRQSGKVRLVVISLRGGDADADRLRGQLTGMGLGKPILLEKKPVAETRGGKGRQRSAP